MKDYRKDELKNYVIGNILIILLFSGILQILFSLPVSNDISNSITEITSKVLGSALLSSVIYIYVFIFDSMIPSKLKDFIIYFPCGRPGNTIFENIESKEVDSRFTPEEAKEKYADIYKQLATITDVKKRKSFQNSKWYSIYQTVEDNETVALSQKDFLLNRDMCAITVVVFALYLMISKLSGLYDINNQVLLWLVSEFIITNIAAKSKAKRFVLNVITKDIHKPLDTTETEKMESEKSDKANKERNDSHK